jgi:hypothetical protein
MCRACSTNEENVNAYRILMGKRQLRIRRCRWVDNIKTYLRAIGQGGMDWIDVI